jgi:small-conductance mechanosensitive channel
VLVLTAATGRLIATAVVVAVVFVVGWPGSHLLTRRHRDDRFARYQLRRTVRYLASIGGVIALLIVWRAFAGRAGLVFGLFAAGIAFAMQEVIGALFGWVNILTGRIYRVGDRVELAGVQGDVIDIAPLRTKILEMGSELEGDTATSWVRGRQYTGRVVAISNKATFTDPVYNYSAIFEYVWEEMAFPIPYRADWHEAERIIREEVERVSDTEGAQQAIGEMQRSHPLPRTEVEPRVFVRATDNWMELAARFVVPVRTSRTVKDEVTRRIRDRLDAAGIEIASTTMDVTVRRDEPG